MITNDEHFSRFDCLLPVEPPDRPDNVRVTDIESRSSIVRWSIPYSGNSIILSFTLEYKKKPVSWESKEILTETILGSINSMNLRNLEPTTIYQLRMKSTNALGSSEFSDIIEFKTDEESKLENFCFRSFEKKVLRYQFSFASISNNDNDDTELYHLVHSWLIS